MSVSSNCIKLAFLRSSRRSNVHPRFVTFAARKTRPWGNEPIISVDFPVRKCNDGFTNFTLSYSDKRDKSHSDDKSKNKSASKWKTISLAGAVLFAIAQSRSESNFFSNWFTVHAAKPVASDRNEYDSRFGRNRPSSDDVSLENSQPTKAKSRRQQFNFIADVVEKAARSVVCIEIKDHSHMDWFGGAPQTSSNGSGFIIHSDGLILTNAHVVDSNGKTSIAVRLHDGRTFVGQLYAVDPKSDLALIRISEKNLPVLSLGCSSDTRIGEWVAAIGSPLKLSNSVTAGVISSVNRGASELGISNNISFLQTDASITFGNSGGPLVNLDGDAIGINSLKISAGISFAIPSDYVKKFLAEVETRRKAGRPMPFRRYMGLTLITLTADIVADLEQRGNHCRVNQGVFVVTVVVGSPAFLAGIQPGDIIIKINDKNISSAKDVYDVLEVSPTLDIIVMRGAKKYRCIVHPVDVK